MLPWFSYKCCCPKCHTSFTEGDRSEWRCNSDIGFPLSKPWTRTFAGRELTLSLPKPYPTSAFTGRWAWQQKSAKVSLRWLCWAMTSPPCLQEAAWWLSGSKAMPGQKGHREPPEVSTSIVYFYNLNEKYNGLLKWIHHMYYYYM